MDEFNHGQPDEVRANALLTQEDTFLVSHFVPEAMRGELHLLPSEKQRDIRSGKN